MKKTTQLKSLLHSNNIEFIMEAHNGISAKIVEEAGFKGIWGSGLAISASMGVRDNNEMSWTQVLDILEFMSDASSLPILLDGDTGYGNFNSVRRLVKKLESIDIAGVCLEDKIFPKTNSFIGGERQPLADIDEFCGKIKAGKDTQKDEDFIIVARVEAFIAGWGLTEALKRANAYADAGADAILIHSKLAEPTDIFQFMKNWDNRKPIVIVPTKYYKTPTADLAKAGASLAIWANHTMRSSISAMQNSIKQIYKEQSLVGIEPKIIPVSEIFRLQNADEYKTAEESYLPQDRNISAYILAATKGDNFGSLTDNKPKCMLEAFGKSILENQIETMNECKIRQISVVVGYKKEVIDLPNITKIDNDQHDTSGILYSYYLASKHFQGPCIMSFGDILFKQHILRTLLEAEGDIVLVIDTSWWQGRKAERKIDSVICTTPPSDSFESRSHTPILQVDSSIAHNDAHGEWVGMMKFSSLGAEIFRKELEIMRSEDEEAFLICDINSFMNRLIKKGLPVTARYVHGHWLNINSLEDIYQISNMPQQ
ncbi:MAG: phosphoenolpyruvate mutase [Magnetococcales bacterium]|nr:phosphoenolpyruvate mutase [Magnetococcales bacterium]